MILILSIFCMLLSIICLYLHHMHTKILIKEKKKNVNLEEDRMHLLAEINSLKIEVSVHRAINRNLSKQVSSQNSLLMLSEKDMKILRFHIHPDKTQGKTSELYLKIFNK